jgi:hypothetical protein
MDTISPEMQAYFSSPAFLAYNAAYQAACAADAAYSQALVKEFGKGAGDARYISHLNKSTAELRALAEAWQAACVASARALVVLRSAQEHRAAFGW